MDLPRVSIPPSFLRSMPKGLRLARKRGRDMLLVESLYCPRGHSLMAESVRIHGEPSVRLNVSIRGGEGHLFLDAFWGSHARLISFLPPTGPDPAPEVEASCPDCGASLMTPGACREPGCGAARRIVLRLPGPNRIAVCARLGCPGHSLEGDEVPPNLADTVSRINYFGAGADDFFGGV